MTTSLIFACFVIVGAVFCWYMCFIQFLKMFFKGKIFNFLCQITYPVVIFGLYYIAKLVLCMGKFRLYTVIAYIFGFILYYITFYKILDKLHKIIYNKLTDVNGIKYTKLGRFILK